jgi:hypothetical protein
MYHIAVSTQGDIGQGLTPCDMDLPMFCSFYHILVHKITYDSSPAIKGSHTIKGI